MTRIVLTMGGLWGPQRRMTTYVNAKMCATISKGVFEKHDGRFAVPGESIVFFASAKDVLMPGLRVKLIEFRPHCMSLQTVQESAQLNGVSIDT